MGKKNKNKDNSIKKENVLLYLEEYKAIEQMHIHYDTINASMTVVVTAGTFALWGIILQTGFQSPDYPYEDLSFANSISALALTVLAVLSIWIRYLTIHRCIVIQKLERSHEIERILGMKQNLLFFRNMSSLKIPEEDDSSSGWKTKPGGHTLELLLYFFLSFIGIVLASIFQWHNRCVWEDVNKILFGILLITPFLSVIWIAFCRLDAIKTISGKVEVGFPWSFLFTFIKPINAIFRRIFYSFPKQF